MRLSKEFDVKAPAGRASLVLAADATLTGLFPSMRTEIVRKQGATRTTHSHYRMLGQEGVAVFHFTQQTDGGLAFEKECDGRLWKQLSGLVSLRTKGDGARVKIEIEGKTKGLVPEFTIKKPLEDQLDEMVSALKKRIDAGPS